MKTQEERVLERLRKGHTLTSWQAINWWGMTRLGAVVFAINENEESKLDYTLKKTYPYIVSKLVPRKNRYGQKVWIAEYSL